MAEKTTMEQNFEKQSNKIFKNNVKEYTENDLNFLKGLRALYGNAMSVKGINVLDPIHANIFHYNKMHMNGLSGIPNVTRTQVFFTRPECNWSAENIDAIPFFKWLYSKKIGRVVMACLTDPEYFIGAPAIFNTLNYKANANELLAKISETASRIEQNNNEGLPKPDMASNTGADFEESGIATSDNTDNIKELEAELNRYSNETKSSTLASNTPETQPDTSGTDDINKDNYKEYSTYTPPSGNEEYDKAMKALNDIDDVTEQQINNSTGMNSDFVRAKNVLQESGMMFENMNFTSPFIPLLSNQCTNCSGFKDYSIEQYTYEEDYYQNALNIAKGMDGTWNGGTCMCNFDDITYSPVGLLIMTWVLYIHYVSRGYIIPTRNHITERVLDYTSSIYVFVLGEDGRKIERWGKFTGCYPISYPMASQVEHNATPDGEMLHKLSITFATNRNETMNPEIFTDFNFLSESEWLVKLKDPFWENLYTRMDPSKYDGSYYDYKNYKDMSPYQISMLRILRRNPNIWTAIEPGNEGMSGKLPTELIESDKTLKINNVWGGYPYVNAGTDLIWVRPEWNELSDVLKDNIYKEGDRINAASGSPINNAIGNTILTNKDLASDSGTPFIDSNKDDLPDEI